MTTYKSPKLMLCVRYTRTTFCCSCVLTLTAAAVFQSGRAAGGRCYSCCCYRVSEWALYTYLPLGNLCQWWARPRQGNTRPGEPVHTKTPHGHLPPLHHLPHPHPPPAQVDLLKVSIFTSFRSFLEMGNSRSQLQLQEEEINEITAETGFTKQQVCLNNLPQSKTLLK